MGEADESGREAVTAIHLDAVGGIAGDMFVAALLDAIPTIWADCERAIAAVAPPADVQAALVAYSDGVLTGKQFRVSGVDELAPHDAHSHEHAAGHHHDHGDGGVHHHHPREHAGHHPWRDIRRRLEAAALKQGEREAAIGIFERLAVAEASVHGIAVDDVAFHEVGAWDSIVDIVAAAAIIAQMPECAWSVGALPRGRGLVRSAHGLLPAPAPATVELLKGYELFDDGEEGERLTPTGAAILNYLAPSRSADPTPRRLLGSGSGFGTRRLKRRSNMLRATLYGGAAPAMRETVEVLRCEVDDQTGEDLAVALDGIRRLDGVLDVCQWPVYAKKGRLAVAVQVLARDGTGERVARAMLDETTTLGVRIGAASRAVVERTRATADGVRVKLAHRPSGVTAKAEMDDLAELPTHAARQQRRALIERSVLEDDGDEE